MSLSELFANEQALRADLSKALHDEKHAAELAAAATASAKAAHDAALAQFEAALNAPVEPDADPTLAA